MASPRPARRHRRFRRDSFAFPVTRPRAGRLDRRRRNEGAHCGGAARYGGVGADLVNHCVNDILVCNATPLFFLDYLAVGKLDPALPPRSYAAARRPAARTTARCSAERPRRCLDSTRPTTSISPERSSGSSASTRFHDPQSVVPGDAIVGLPAVGLHTNGYSLARSLLPRSVWTRYAFDDATYADALLAEHPSYYRSVRAIQAVANVKAMAHITGGGLLENVPRTLPENVKAIFEQQRWSVPPIMQEFVRRGDLAMRGALSRLQHGHRLHADRSLYRCAGSDSCGAGCEGRWLDRSTDARRATRRRPSRARRPMMERLIRSLALAVDSESPRDQRASAAAEIIRNARGYRRVGIYDVDDEEIVLIGYTGSFRRASTFRRYAGLERRSGEFAGYGSQQ